MTKTVAIAKVTSHKIMPSTMIMAWFTSMPTPASASTATPTANGFTVEPKTPQPAPRSTTAAPVSESKPAATMVAASSR